MIEDSTKGKLPPPKNENKSKKMLVVGGIFATLIIAVLIGIIFDLMKKPEVVPKPVVAQGRGTVVTPENVEEIKSKIEQPTEDGYYRIKMNNKWTFKTSKTPSENAYVANSEANTRTVYIDVALKETDQLVYSSPYIPVGSELGAFALDVDLEPGEYPARVTYHLVDDENNEVTTVNVGVKITVQE